MTAPVHLSVVTPAYKCAECIAEMHRRLAQVLSGITPHWELIFVDDGSPAGDWTAITQVCAADPRVRGIRLSRNYGQHFAITAGLDHAQGDWVVVMDCDLQDVPEEIPKLYAKAQEGHDIVMARRLNRSDPAYRKLLSNGFRRLFNWLGDIEVEEGVANFSIASRAVVRSICSFRERDRSYPFFLQDAGFSRVVLDVNQAPRFAGQSSYSFGKLLDLALQCIVARSNKPLRLSIRFGLLLGAAALFYGLFLIVRYFMIGVPVEGWTTLAVLISFLGGLGFINLGIVGLYLGKVFDQVKHRPLYLVRQTVNDPAPTAEAVTLVR